MSIKFTNLTQPVFDAALGQYMKKHGMTLAEINNPKDLQVARSVAITIAKNGDGTCHADRVGRVLKKYFGIDTLGPSAGSLFKGDHWEFTGQRVRSARVSNHRREIKVWRLRGQQSA